MSCKPCDDSNAIANAREYIDIHRKPNKENFGIRAVYSLAEGTGAIPDNELVHLLRGRMAMPLTSFLNAPSQQLPHQPVLGRIARIVFSDIPGRAFLLLRGRERIFK